MDTTEAPGAWTQPAGWRTLAELMDAPDRNPGVEIDLDALAGLMYTSGTTGAPKGVVGRYRGTNIATLKIFGAVLKPDDVLYTCLPLFHANALFLTTLRSLVMGLPMVLSRRFSASRFWDEIRKYGFQLISYPLATIVASVAGVIDLWRGVLETGIAKYDPEKAKVVREEIENAIGLPEFWEIEKETVEAAERDWAGRQVAGYEGYAQGRG